MALQQAVTPLTLVPPEAGAGGGPEPAPIVPLPHVAMLRLAATHLQKRRGRSDAWASLQRVRVPDRMLSQFAESLAAMYNAGVPLSRAIEVMSHQPEMMEWGLVIAAINRDLRNGRSLVDCFASFPHIFGPTWMALMRRAMEDGSIGETLQALADFHARNHLLRARVIAACTYPLVIFGISVLIALGAFAFILPQIVGTITSSGKPIPFATQVLIFVMNVMTHPLFLLEAPVLLFVNGLALRRFLRTERGRMRLDRVKCSLPVFGPLFRKMAVARLMNSLKATVSSGLRVTLALELAGAACGNGVYFLHMLRCVQALRDGERLSRQFDGPLYDPMVGYSILVGEECGQLDHMLGTLSQYYDLEVSTALDNLLTMLEPFLILGTGVLVAFVVLALFLPLYGMVNGLA